MPNAPALHPLTPITQVEIENFRGVRRLDIKLDPDITVLFGSNAAGKTTLLDAIAIGLGVMVSRVPKAKGRSFARRDIRVPPKDRDDFDEQAGVERIYTSVVLHTAAVSWGITKWRSASDQKAGLSKIGPIQLRAALDPMIREALDAKPGTPTTAIPLMAAYGTERAVVEVPLRERDFSKEVGRFGALDDALNATTRFKRVFEWFRVMEEDERREQSKRRDFDYRLPELEWVRRAVEQSQLSISNPRIETRPIRMLVDFTRRDGQVETLDLRSLSDGYRTHFALVVDVARRMVQLNPSNNLSDPLRGTNSPGVVLIDEVDLHLDPPWQARVMGGLKAVFPNAQFVVSTHSEQVLGSVRADQVRRLDWDDGAISAQPVPFAQGARTERILVELMGATERVEGPVTRDLQRYAQLVSQQQATSAEATALRTKLEAAIPGDRRLHQADLEQQRQAVMSRLLGQ
jgi:predicted ATP-binding protein involved in virulence